MRINDYSNHLIWIAHLSNGEQIYEGAITHTFNDGRNSYSSDFLNKEDVICLEYRPLIPSKLSIKCNIDLEMGERFVRYWTVVKDLINGKEQRLYVVGWYKIINNEKHYSLFYYYPDYNAFTLSNSRFTGIPYKPSLFGLLKEAETFNMLGSRDNFVGWRDKFNEAYLMYFSNRSIMLQSSISLLIYNNNSNNDNN